MRSEHPDSCLEPVTESVCGQRLSSFGRGKGLQNVLLVFIEANEALVIPFKNRPFDEGGLFNRKRQKSLLIGVLFDLCGQIAPGRAPPVNHRANTMGSRPGFDFVFADAFRAQVMELMVYILCGQPFARFATGVAVFQSINCDHENLFDLILLRPG